MDNVLEEIQKAYDIKKIDYPVAEFIIVFGFFLVLIVEQVVLDFKERWLHTENKEQPHSSNFGSVEYVSSPETSDEIDEASSLIANTSEPLSTTLAGERPTQSNRAHKRKSSGNQNCRNNYGSTAATSSSPKGSQYIDSSGEHPIQHNNNQICR